jgi:hypothetical protein
MSDLFLKLSDFVARGTDAVDLVRERCLRTAFTIMRARARYWYRGIWRRDLNGLLCCSGFGSYGQVACGCYGPTLREYLLDSLKR